MVGSSSLILTVLFSAIFFYVLFLVIRAAVLSALRTFRKESGTGPVGGAGTSTSPPV
ncbi:MAG: hypothetical protein J0H64_10790 [Actinobacteria bacterium]|nr:hypothetical protein [Actinomycetota bacterium]